MPIKKLTAVSIPTLAPGDWHDVVVPGLILRVGPSAGHGPIAPARAAESCGCRLAIIPSWGWPRRVRPPARRQSGSTAASYRQRLRRIHGRLTRSRSAACSTVTRRCAARGQEDQDARRGDAADPARSGLTVAAGRPVLKSRSARRPRCHGRGRRCVRRQPHAGYLGPAMRWAAQEDLIPTNFVPDIRKAPEKKRTRKLTDAEIEAIWNACATSAAARRRRISAAWCVPTGRRRSDATKPLRFVMAIFSTAHGGRPTTRRAGRKRSCCRRWRCR